MKNAQKNNELIKDVNTPNWLKLAEYISLSGSVAGSILAIASQQVAYAAVPLTLALSLNVVNRDRFQQQARLSTKMALLAEPVDLYPINQSLEQLEQKTQTLTQFNARETQAITQLTSQLDALALRFDTLPNPPEPFDLSGIEAEIATLQTQQQAIDFSVTTSIAQLQTELQTQIDQLLQQIQSLPSHFNSSALEQRLTELERKNHSIFSDDVGSLASVMNHLQSDKAFIQKVLTHLTTELDILAQQFYSRPEAQLLTHLTNQLDTLAQQFYSRPETQVFASTNHLDASVREVSAQQETQAIAHLTNQLNALELRLDNLSNPPEPVNLGGIEAEIATLKAQVRTIELSHVTSNVDPSTSLRVNLSGIEADISNLKLQSQLQIVDLYSVIEQLSQKIKDLPSPFDSSTLEQRLNELETTHSIFSDDVSSLVSVVKRLQSDKSLTTEAIAQLTHQLNTLASRLDNLPTPPEPVDLSDIEAAISSLHEQLGDLVEQLNTQPEPIDIQWLDERIALTFERFGELNQLQQVLEQISAIEQQLKDLDVSTADVHDYAFKLKNDLEQRVSQLNQETSELDERTQRLSETPRQLQEIKQLTAGLDEKTTALDERTRNLAQMEQKIEMLHLVLSGVQERTGPLNNRNLDEIQQQLTSLWQLVNESAKTTDLDSALARLSEEIAGQIDTAIEKQISQFRAQLTTNLNERTKHLREHTRMVLG